MEDWLQAERQLMWMPDTGEFQARVDVSGLEPRDIRVITLPDSIVLQAEPKSQEAKLFQRFSFSKPIDVDKVDFCRLCSDRAGRARRSRLMVWSFDDDCAGAVDAASGTLMTD